jgi:hypothetical protein
VCKVESGTLSILFADGKPGTLCRWAQGVKQKFIERFISKAFRDSGDCKLLNGSFKESHS